MQEYIDLLFSPEAMAIYAMVAYVFTHHILQYLPESITSKIPDFVMVLLNTIGAKHGSDLAAKTDMKGNIIDATKFEAGK